MVFRQSLGDRIAIVRVATITRNRKINAIFPQTRLIERTAEISSDLGCDLRNLFLPKSGISIYTGTRLAAVDLPT